ncbi:hypothetical protein ACFL0X_00595 [Nanoarchaeota archaeon]
MKKEIIIFSLLILLPLTTAVQVEMNSEFSQGETLIAKVSGNFLEPLSNQNILFYKGHVRIPVEFDIAKIDQDYYIYAQLQGKAPNNYSISIEDTRYTKELNEETDDKIVENFSIKNQIADFSIEPGFVITKDDFSIILQNLQDNEIIVATKIKTDSGGEGFFDSLFGIKEIETKDSATLKPGESKKINFEIKNITEKELRTIELSTENTEYEVPLYIYEKPQEPSKERILTFEQTELNVTLSTNSTTTRIIYLENQGDFDLENITLTISDRLTKYMTLSEDKIEYFRKDTIKKIEINIASDEFEQQIEGQIKAKTSDNLYAYLAVYLNFVEDYKPSEEEIQTTSKTCKELGGKICNKTQECEGETEYTEGVCCLGNCKEVTESSTLKIVGWSIVIIVILFLVWFFKTKYKGAQRVVDFSKFAGGS